MSEPSGEPAVLRLPESIDLRTIVEMHQSLMAMKGRPLDLDGSAEADFSGFIEESANVGLTYTHKPVTLRLNVNYRGRQINSQQTGSGYGGASGGFYEYYAARTNVDLNGEYAFSPKLALFANVRNVFNVPQDLERYNSVTPGWAKLYRREKFGAQITIGVKGTF